MSTLFQRVIAFFTKRKKVQIYIYSLVFFPGTLMHELSHAIMAIILFIPIKSFRIVPKIEDEKIVLGHVIVEKKDFIRRALVSVAPLIFGIGILYSGIGFVVSRDFFGSVWGYILTGYAVFQISNSMFISNEDFKGLFPFILFISVTIGLLYVLGIQVVWSDTHIATLVHSVSKTLSYFMIVPLVINGLLLALYKLLKR